MPSTRVLIVSVVVVGFFLYQSSASIPAPAKINPPMLIAPQEVPSSSAYRPPPFWSGVGGSDGWGRWGGRGFASF